MSDRIHIDADALKVKWFSADSTGMIHDHSTSEVVVTMLDGSEYACSFDEHLSARDIEGGER